MLCEQCGKKPAVVHVRKVQNDQKIERHLCRECAQQSGELSGSFDFQSMLAGLFEHPSVWSSEKADERRCPVCGSTLRDIQKRSQLGCSRCYSFYEQEVDTLLRRIHGTTKHVGKVPVKAGGKVRTERRLQDLRDELKRLVSIENYEKAAVVRDQIRSLEKELP